MALAAVGVLGLAAGGAWFALAGGSGGTPEVAALPEHEFNYGPKNSQVFGLRRALEKKPCDRALGLELVQLMFNAEDWRGVVLTADAFTAQCGRFDQMRQLTYTAHTRLSEFDLAIRDVSELLESAPGNVGYWIWRGLAHEAGGKSEQALTDFQQAFTLQPTQAHVANQLASAYERQHKPCDALLTLLQHLQAGTQRKASRELIERIALLEAVGKCDVGGKGQAVVTSTRQGGMWVEPTLNGKEKGRFLVDTGSTAVVISSAFAQKLGLNLQNAPTLPIQTDTGTSTVQVVTVQSIELQGARAQGVTVHVSSTLPADMDGRLGLGFLARFEMKLDAQAGRLELAERKPL